MSAVPSVPELARSKPSVITDTGAAGPRTTMLALAVSLAGDTWALAETPSVRVVGCDGASPEVVTVRELPTARLPTEQRQW